MSSALECGTSHKEKRIISTPRMVARAARSSERDEALLRRDIEG